MLRRNSSKRLSQRKSTSSTCIKHGSIDREVARRHAQTAATLAFTRAQERTSTDGGIRGNRLSRSNTDSSQINRQALPQPANNSDVSHTNKGIKRQQSVRFAGPNAAQHPQSNATRAPQAAIERDQSAATLEPMALTTDTPVPAAYRPPSRSSSLGKASSGRGKAESFVTAVAAYNAYYTREDDIASTPSSYRRIRKSKSMFSPLKAPSVFYTNGTPERSGGSYISTHDNTPNYQSSYSQPYEAPLRVQRSMSFLRGGREYIARERNDEAVQMARDRFFQQTTQQRLREQPSFLFRSKVQRQDKPFRKSVRTASTSNHSATVNTSDHPKPIQERGIKNKARKASRTFKDKLKKVFGRNKDSVHIPNQQVDAHETHVRKYCGDPELIHNNYEGVPHPTQATLSRVASRPPSLHEMNSSQKLRSFAGSVKSAQSDHSFEKSRVTSWDTSGVNTLTSQAARLQAERELQRLSIINENGTHIPSSSFSRPTLNQTSAYPFHHRPSKSAGHIPSSAPGPVDSARVYSALMKRLDESSPRAKLEASRKASMENFIPAIIVQQRSDSSSSRGDRTPVTIRHVLPDDPDETKALEIPPHQHEWIRSDSVHSAQAGGSFSFAGAHVHQWAPADPLREARVRQEDDVFSPKDVPLKGRALETNFQQHRRRRSDTSLHPLSHQPRTMATRYTGSNELGLTPQEIAHQNEPAIQWQQPFRESRSTFFGGSSITIARSISPFRRAQAEKDFDSSIPSAQSQSNPNPIFLGTTPATIIAIDGGSQENHKAYSDSIYSRTTSGRGPAAENSSLSLVTQDETKDELLPHAMAGDVIIIDSRTYRPAVPANRSQRGASSGGSAGSSEWKNWMSCEVAKLERAKENTNGPTSYVNYALPTMPKSFQAGHIRESAQISDDYSDIAQGKSGTAKQPLGILQKNNNVQNVPRSNPQNIPHLKPILKKHSTVSLLENSEPTKSDGAVNPIPPAPPIPFRSPLMQKPSRSSLPSTYNANSSRPSSVPGSTIKLSSFSGRNTLHKRSGSASTLKSTDNVEGLGKLVKKANRSSCTVSQASSGGRLSTSEERHFGTTSTRSRNSGGTWTVGHENNHPGKRDDDIYGIDGAGLMGPAVSGGINALDAQQTGSKRMVDIFLSSRRKRIAGGSDESGVFI
jgi:hypothetical protein